MAENDVAAALSRSLSELNQMFARASGELQAARTGSAYGQRSSLVATWEDGLQRAQRAFPALQETRRSANERQSGGSRQSPRRPPKAREQAGFSPFNDIEPHSANTCNARRRPITSASWHCLPKTGFLNAGRLARTPLCISVWARFARTEASQRLVELHAGLHSFVLATRHSALGESLDLPP